MQLRVVLITHLSWDRTALAKETKVMAKGPLFETDLGLFGERAVHKDSRYPAVLF
jgi:hypothetical protein